MRESRDFLDQHHSDMADFIAARAAMLWWFNTSLSLDSCKDVDLRVHGYQSKEIDTTTL
jgi:hypothetical protein